MTEDRKARTEHVAKVVDTVLSLVEALCWDGQEGTVVTVALVAEGQVAGFVCLVFLLRVDQRSLRLEPTQATVFLRGLELHHLEQRQGILLLLNSDVGKEVDVVTIKLQRCLRVWTFIGEVMAFSTCKLVCYVRQIANVACSTSDSDTRNKARE